MNRIINSKFYEFCQNNSGGSLEDCENAMQEYADQKSEKRAVAFAEWKDRNTAISELGGYFLTSTNVPIYFKRLYKDSSDLYQYWLTNVKNK